MSNVVETLSVEHCRACDIGSVVSAVGGALAGSD